MDTGSQQGSLVRPDQGHVVLAHRKHEKDSNNETKPAETRCGDGTNPPRETRQQTRQRVASEAFAEDQTKIEAKTTAARTLADTSACAETGAARAGETAVEGCRIIFGSERSQSPPLR
jgi:hypothetical protein